MIGDVGSVDGAGTFGEHPEDTVVPVEGNGARVAGSRENNVRVAVGEDRKFHRRIFHIVPIVDASERLYPRDATAGGASCQERSWQRGGTTLHSRRVAGDC